MPKLYTKNGHDFYVVASLLQKAIRRGDFKRAGYAANEFFGLYHGFLWNRLLIISAEDCSAMVTDEILALRKADEYIHKNKKPYNKIFVGKAIAILLEAFKGREGDYVADSLMREINPEMRADPYFNQDDEAVDIENITVDDGGELFPDYVYDPHTWKGKSMGRHFKNYDFDHIETKDMKPKSKQPSLFDGHEWVYDDMYDENQQKTMPGYKIKLKKFGEE
jgi:replication-associated recombination protein RarA